MNPGSTHDEKENGMAGWIESMVSSMGVLGVALLMFLENVFPPIPSELIMPLAGYTAAKGNADIVLVILSGTVGSLAGASFWYAIGRWFGEERLKRFADQYGRWLTLSRQDIDRADDWFDRHGAKAVFFGRLVPTVRTLISVPAGLSEMPLPRFLLWSGAGTLIWTSFLALLGWWLGDRYEDVETWINPISNVIVSLIVILYLYRVATFRRHGRA